MHTFRTRRPLLVNATQCTKPTVILTDSGQRKAFPGDWIIEGENHERYIVDNTFFQRTFAPIPWEPSSRRPPLRQLAFHSPSTINLNPNLLRPSQPGKKKA